MTLRMYAAAAGAMGLLGLGAGIGAANADAYPLLPATDDNPTYPIESSSATTGPGAADDSSGALPLGRSHLPSPERGGPVAADLVSYPAVPYWLFKPVPPPVGAAPAPAPPAWANTLPVVWNPELAAWGVWDGGIWNSPDNVFVRI